jgi:hypothetical protein
MSDVVPCPACHQYIDVTFFPEKCPKCGKLLKGVDLSTEPVIDAAEIKAIDSYLILSIVSCLFCCLPGLVAVIFSLLTVRDKKQGRYSEALSHSLLARNIALAAIIIGGILFVLRFAGSLGR